MSDSPAFDMDASRAAFERWWRGRSWGLQFYDFSKHSLVELVGAETMFALSPGGDSYAVEEVRRGWQIWVAALTSGPSTDDTKSQRMKRKLTFVRNCMNDADMDCCHVDQSRLPYLLSLVGKSEAAGGEDVEFSYRMYGVYDEHPCRLRTNSGEDEYLPLTEDMLDDIVSWVAQIRVSRMYAGVMESTALEPVRAAERAVSEQMRRASVWEE